MTTKSLGGRHGYSAGHHAKELRSTLFELYKGLCAYCGDRLPRDKGTVDHCLAQDRGGTDAVENLRWACFDCNNRKGNKSPEEWEAVKPPYRPALSREQQRAAALELLAERIRNGRKACSGAGVLPGAAD